MSRGPTSRIRSATVADALAIGRVQVVGWQTTYRGLIPDSHLDLLTAEGRAEIWRRGIEAEPADQHWLVAENHREEVVGFIAAGPERDNHPDYAAEFQALYLLPEVRGQGLGSRLLAASARCLQQAGYAAALVWVLADNPYRRFYEARGGTRIADKTVTIGGRDLIEVAYGYDLGRLTGNHVEISPS